MTILDGRRFATILRLLTSVVVVQSIKRHTAFEDHHRCLVDGLVRRSPVKVNVIDCSHGGLSTTPTGLLAHTGFADAASVFGRIF